MIINTSGSAGSSSTVGGNLTVLTDAGATVTATSGFTQLSTTADSSGLATFTITSNGNYIIKSTTDNIHYNQSVVGIGEGQYGSPLVTTDFYGPSGATLNDCSWSEISEWSTVGSSYWAVGDTKDVQLSGTVGTLNASGLTFRVYIIEFDHNSSIEGTGISFGTFKNTDGTSLALCDSKYNTQSSGNSYFNMNNSNTNSGGWKSSTLRYYILGSTNSNKSQTAPTTTPTNPVSNSLIAAFPSDLRAVMKPITIYSDNSGGGSDTASYVTSTTDYLPLLSEWEVHGARTYANSAEKNYQTQFAYYQNGNAKIKYRHDNVGTAVRWWCRSVYSSNSSDFCNVSDNGNAANAGAYYSYGVAPRFLV